MIKSKHTSANAAIPSDHDRCDKSRFYLSDRWPVFPFQWSPKVFQAILAIATIKWKLGLSQRSLTCVSIWSLRSPKTFSGDPTGSSYLNKGGQGLAPIVSEVQITLQLPIPLPRIRLSWCIKCTFLLLLLLLSTILIHNIYIYLFSIRSKHIFYNTAINQGVR